MDFSIITPSLNYGRFLGECLRSVSGQAGVTLEHLVMDGGSTDESAQVAAGFAHAQWLQAPDDGMSDAINKGFERARGDWVMWLNADDRLQPGALAVMLERLQQTTADVVYGDWDFVNEAGDFQRRVRALRWSAFVNLYHHCYVGSTAAFYRRATVIDEGYRLREDFRYVMDGELYARLAAAGKTFKHVPVVVADFRLHGANASQRHLVRTRDMATILAAERQHVESRAMRRAYGFRGFRDPYLTGLVDGVLWIVAKGWKVLMRCLKI